MELTINRNFETSLYLQIKKQLTEMILKDELYDGFVMPSERKLAKMLGVHRNTIMRVYGELKAEELLISQERKGYIVSRKKLGAVNHSKSHSISWASRINEECLDLGIVNSFNKFYRKNTFDKYYREHTGISFVGNIGCRDADRDKAISRILCEIAESEDDSKYLSTHIHGDERLRQSILDCLCKKGMHANPSEIQIVSETYQALDYLIDLLLRPGDPVIVCEPLCPDIFRTFAEKRMKIITVGMDQEGILLEQLESLIKQYKPKLIYIEPDFQNPTGIEMSLARRKDFLKLCYTYEIPIVEESVCTDFKFNGSPLPSLKALDENNNVIFLYSFWYTIPIGIRIAFVCADKVLIRHLGSIFDSRVLCVSSLSQMILRMYIDKGIFQSETKRLCADYKQKMELLCQSIDHYDKNHEKIQYIKPSGGINLWCEVLPHIDFHMFNMKNTEKDVYYFRGSVFFPAGSRYGNFIRLNISQMDESSIQRGIERMMKTAEECTV